MFSSPRSDQPDDSDFAGNFERDLAASGAQVLAVVQGEPKDAREALRKIAASGESWTPSPARRSPGRGSFSRT